MPRARQWCGAEQTDKKGKTKEKIKNADAHFASRFLGLQTIAMKLSTAKKNPNGIMCRLLFLVHVGNGALFPRKEPPVFLQSFLLNPSPPAVGFQAAKKKLVDQPAW